jgi:hypothetical protein
MTGSELAVGLATSLATGIGALAIIGVAVWML